MAEPGFGSVNPHPVDVWTIHLDIARRVNLNPEEEARAARFRFEADRVHWMHARSALRSVLSTYLGTAPETIRFTFNANGKPATGGIEFNLSHTRNRAMIAVSHDVATGIDIELIRNDVEIGKLLHRIGESDVTGSNEQLFRAWTRREARVKALGGQLMEIPRADVIAADVDAPAGFAASVALVNRVPVVRYRGEPE